MPKRCPSCDKLVKESRPSTVRLGESMFCSPTCRDDFLDTNESAIRQMTAAQVTHVIGGTST